MAAGGRQGPGNAFPGLGKRRGWPVNHKRVYRLMRKDNLLCLRKRRFVVTTVCANSSRRREPVSYIYFPGDCWISAHNSGISASWPMTASINSAVRRAWSKLTALSIRLV
jgi:transposase InsO family protein